MEKVGPGRHGGQGMESGGVGGQVGGGGGAEMMNGHM